MSDRLNPLFDPNVIGQPQPNALAPQPTWADAAAWHAQNLQDTWAAVQQPQTWVDAARQYGNAMLMGSVAPEARLANARALGFDTSRTLYHSTPYEFSEFVPNQWRGASYFASTPEGAVRGAGAGGMEHMALSGPTTNAQATGARIIPVHVAGRVWGRDPLPAEWLPQRLTYGQYKAILDGSDVIKPEGFSPKQVESLNMERRAAASKYYTEAVPETEYQNYTGQNEDKLPLKLSAPPVAEPFGYESIEGGSQPNAFAPSGSMSAAERRDMIQRLGYSGWLVRDEAGNSVAIADPTKIRSIFANFDPKQASSPNISASLAAILAGGAAAATQGQ